MRKFIKYVEVLNSPGSDNSLLNEYAYSEALDAGYRVSTTLGRGDFATVPARLAEISILE